jgi:NAD(P)-dependent dehydrogenase (short-subunit alcohol dehydrogenase family)
VSDEAGAQALVDHAVERWGRLDALINNAGLSMRGTVAELRATTVDRLSAVNLRGAVVPTVAALPQLRTQRGAVVFVSTVAALHGFPGVSLYSATKAAVGTFADALAAEEPDISVSTVYLGFVENDADKTTLGADGQAFHHERKAMQTQQAAAEAILQALARRRRRSITVFPGRLLDLAARLAPGLVTRILARSSGKVHGVTRRD